MKRDKGYLHVKSTFQQHHSQKNPKPVVETIQARAFLLELFFTIVFHRSKKKAAKNLQNPRLLRIKFHTFRHWKATMLYHQTKDILYVKESLGHRKIDTTLLYVQLEKALFKEITDEFTVRVAKTPEEIQGLLEVGFEYVCDKDGLLFFRKRK